MHLRRQINPRHTPQPESPSPIDERPCADLLGIMKEIDVATSSQRIDQRDRAVADAKMPIDRTPQRIGLVQITLAIDRRLRVYSRIEQCRR